MDQDRPVTELVTRDDGSLATDGQGNLITADDLPSVRYPHLDQHTRDVLDAFERVPRGDDGRVPVPPETEAWLTANMAMHIPLWRDEDMS